MSSFLFACAENTRGLTHLEPTTWLYINFSVIGSCMMKAALGLQCHLSPPTQSPGKKEILLLFPDLCGGIFLDPLSPKRHFFQNSSLCKGFSSCCLPYTSPRLVNWPHVGVKIYPSSQLLYVAHASPWYHSVAQEATAQDSSYCQWQQWLAFQAQVHI